MKLPGWRYTIPAALILAAGGWVFWKRGPEESAKAKGNNIVKVITGAKSARPDSDRTSEVAGQRQKELARLKAVWDKELAAFKKTKRVSQELKDLAAETVRLLSCSDELAELVKHVKDNYPGYDGLVLSELIEKFLFTQLRAKPAETRQAIVALSKHRDYQQKWAFEAAKYCEGEQLKQFSDALQTPACAQAVVFGHSLYIAKSSPKEALSALANEVKNGQKANFWNLGDVLRDVAQAVPSSANMAELEAVLPPDKGNGAVRRARAELLQTWAATDPDAVAKHILSHPDRIDPKSIGTAIQSFLGVDPQRAVAWVQELPEGVMKDAALAAAAERMSLHHTATARDLAMLIDDQKLQKKTIKAVEDNAPEAGVQR